jgi:hypothetical protein
MPFRIKGRRIEEKQKVIRVFLMGFFLYFANK